MPALPVGGGPGAAEAHPPGAAHHRVPAALSGVPHLAAAQPGGAAAPQPGRLRTEQESPHQAGWRDQVTQGRV